jgi:hypothetical protein
MSTYGGRRRALLRVLIVVRTGSGVARHEDRRGG